MLSLLALAALIQEPAKSPTLSPMFGSRVLGVGDVDGDKVPDFLIGDGGWQPSGSPAAVWILSGKDSHEIFAFHAEDPGLEFPLHIYPAGDADKDGFEDLWLMFAAKPGSADTRVAIWSAKSRSITRDATPEERTPVLARVDGKQLLGDFDRDGVADKRVVHEKSNEIRSGKDDSVLCKISETAMQIVLFDDLDGDGRCELLCTDPNVGVAQGRVFLWSSSNGLPLWDVQDDEYWYFGSTIDIVGDFDGDGIRDWIVGGYNGRSHEAGVASLRSGLDGSQLAKFHRNERNVVVSREPLAKEREH